MKNCGSGGSDKNKTKLACILQSIESTRMRMGSSLTCVSSPKCVYMCVTVWVHFGSILGPFWVHFGSNWGPIGVHLGVQSAFKQESVFRQESTTRQESVFRQECSLDKNSSLDYQKERASETSKGKRAKRARIQQMHLVTHI